MRRGATGGWDGPFGCDQAASPGKTADSVIGSGLTADLGPLRHRTIHVWAVDIDNGVDTADWNSVLSIGEIRRSQRFRFARDRRRFIARRMALRRLLGRYLGLQPARIGISEGGGRKPEIALRDCQRDAAGVWSSIRFNCSHSEGLALLAFARDLSLGVDVERMRPFADADDVARRFFSSHEYRAFRQTPAHDRLAAFYDCWTRKEALVKALGEGLAMPMDSFTVSFGLGRPARLLHLDADDMGDWLLAQLQPAPGFSAALAVRSRGPVSSVMSWH